MSPTSYQLLHPAIFKRINLRKILLLVKPTARYSTTPKLQAESPESPPYFVEFVAGFLPVSARIMSTGASARRWMLLV